jgi:transcriptional regulator GlxA family with amidase domain
MKTILFAVFDQMEMLDFAGPYEVFSAANAVSEEPQFRIGSASVDGQAVECVGGAKLLPDFSWADAPNSDLLIVPGGQGTKNLTMDLIGISLLVKMEERAQHIASVCSGARLLACLSLLDDLEFATHYLVGEEVEEMALGSTYRSDRRYIPGESVSTSAGISAGMDLALHLLEQMAGVEMRTAVERYIGYEKRSDRM